MNLHKYLLDKLPSRKEDVNLLLVYLNRVQYDISQDELGEIQLIQLFLEITSDFYDVKIGAETMFALFEVLYIFFHHNKNLRDSPVGNIMFDSGEYDWYIRNQPNNAAYLLKRIKKLRKLYLKS